MERTDVSHGRVQTGALAGVVCWSYRDCVSNLVLGVAGVPVNDRVGFDGEVKCL